MLVADNLTLELEYRDIVSRSPKINLQNFSSNGMGDHLIWHGKAHAFINTTIPVHEWNASEMELECEGIVSSDQCEELECEESSICVEAKNDIRIRDEADPFFIFCHSMSDKARPTSRAIIKAFLIFFSFFFRRWVWTR